MARSRSIATVEEVRVLTEANDVVIRPVVVGCRTWLSTNDILVDELGISPIWIRATCELTLALTVWLLKFFMDR